MMKQLAGFARWSVLWRSADLGIRSTFFNVALFMIVAGALPSHAAEPAIRLVALGDSLTAGYGLEPKQAFPAVLERALRAKGHDVNIANAGVSGDTSAAGLERFDWAIPDDAEGVILELGANDGLRGIDPKAMRRNLDAILKRLSDRKIPVLLTGMRALNNWGEAYAKEFDAVFGDLAKKHDAILYPFFLEGVALDAKLNLDDGLHPNAKGIEAIAQGILPATEKLIERVRARRAGAAQGPSKS